MSVIELCVEFNLFESVVGLVEKLGSDIITHNCISLACSNNNKTMLNYLLVNSSYLHIPDFYARKSISINTDLECLAILLPYMKINMKLLKRSVMVGNRSIAMFLKKFCIISQSDINSLRDLETAYLNGNSIGLLQEIIHSH